MQKQHKKSTCKKNIIVHCKFCKFDCQKCMCKKSRKRKGKHLKKRRMKRVQIFGKNGSFLVPIRTDRMGRIYTVPVVKVIHKELKFIEHTTEVVTSDTLIPLPLENISTSTQYVYAVNNMGDYDAEVDVQVGASPDGLAHDLGPQRIPAQQTTIVTPLHYSKWIRLRYRSAEAGKSTKLQITFQSQSQGGSIFSQSNK